VEISSIRMHNQSDTTEIEIKKKMDIIEIEDK